MTSLPSSTPPKAVFETSDTYKAWDEDYYPPLAEKFYDWAIARLLRAMNVQPGQKILDAGCGPGVHSVRVARAGFQTHAIDLSSVAVAEAQRRVAAAGLSGKVTFQQADLTKLPFESGSFDHIFSWGVIIHIPPIEAALSELARVLKPGGSLALYLNNGAALDVVSEKVGRFLLRKPPLNLEHLPLGDGRWYTFQNERLWLWRFNVPALTRHLASFGLTRTQRIAGEFTEFQRYFKGLPRTALLHLNNLYFKMHFPAAPASANLLVFKKAS